MKEITEMCPFCDHEITWTNIPNHAKYGVCTNCGQILHFCDECMYNNGDHCDPTNPRTAYCYCHYMKEPVGWKQMKDDLTPIERFTILMKVFPYAEYHYDAVTLRQYAWEAYDACTPNHQKSVTLNDLIRWVEDTIYYLENEKEEE